MTYALNNLLASLSAQNRRRCLPRTETSLVLKLVATSCLCCTVSNYGSSRRSRGNACATHEVSTMFEWCEGCRALQPALSHTVQLIDSARSSHSLVPTQALVVGCGTSALSAEVQEAGIERVHSVDVDAAAIQFMREQHKQHERLTWQVMDLTVVPAEGLASGAFDLVVDKGTLDYFLCGEALQSASALANVHAALAADGL
eukprot:5600893-Amphidinium_carterae.1